MPGVCKQMYWEGKKTIVPMIMIDSIQKCYLLNCISLLFACVFGKWFVCIVYKVFTVSVFVYVYSVCVCVGVCSRDCYSSTDFLCDYEMCGQHSPLSFFCFLPCSVTLPVWLPVFPVAHSSPFYGQDVEEQAAAQLYGSTISHVFLVLRHSWWSNIYKTWVVFIDVLCRIWLL